MTQDVRNEVVLIGPVGSGKSTVGRLLAPMLGLTSVAMDDVRWTYYAELDYSSDEAEHRLAGEGFRGMYQYWKPFELHALERGLQDHRDCVIDLGAGHSVYEDPELFARARAALAPFSNVVLLMPSPDSDRSVGILASRRPTPSTGGKWDLNPHFVRHHSNWLLAKHVVYTEGRTPEETAIEVVNITNVLRQAGQDTGRNL